MIRINGKINCLRQRIAQERKDNFYLRLSSRALVVIKDNILTKGVEARPRV
jgi:hypothetical protein